ncbi:MAG TPA: putative maltokinase, partial [Polyangia bacterium]
GHTPTGGMPAVGTATTGVLLDAFGTGDATWSLLETMNGTAGLRGRRGRLVGTTSAALGETLAMEPRPSVRTPELEQSNTVLFVGERAMLKIYRQIDPGINAELEIGHFLSERSEGRVAPRVWGAVQYEQRGQASSVVAIAQEFVPNEGDAWHLTTDAIELFFERVLTEHPAGPPPLPPTRWTEAARTEIPGSMLELAGRYFSLARQLGKRTGEVHNLLGKGGTDPAFSREPFSPQHQQSIYQWSHVRLARLIENLTRRAGQLPIDARPLANTLVQSEKAVDDLLKAVAGRRIDVDRIRTHGDLHLGQVLFTGDDFVIIDFEGEPARPANERRYKRGALRDVMGMIRSFSYATEAVLRGGRVRAEDRAALEPWATSWTQWVSAAYLNSYLQTVAGQRLVPTDDAVTDLLLEFYELEKVIYEIDYEMSSRPDWVRIPMVGLLRILARRSQA